MWRHPHKSRTNTNWHANGTQYLIIASKKAAHKSGPRVDRVGVEPTRYCYRRIFGYILRTTSVILSIVSTK